MLILSCLVGLPIHSPQGSLVHRVISAEWHPRVLSGRSQGSSEPVAAKKVGLPSACPLPVMSQARWKPYKDSLRRRGPYLSHHCPPTDTGLRVGVRLGWQP